MSDVVYRIVEHDGGWAYKLGDVFSETFPNRLSAEAAAKRVADEQRSPGEDEAISWEDERGVWHDEAARGVDRPNAYVAGSDAFGFSTGPRSTGHDEVVMSTETYLVSADANDDQRVGSGFQLARGPVRSDPLIVMLLTIAFAYILGLFVERKV